MPRTNALKTKRRDDRVEILPPPTLAQQEAEKIVPRRSFEELDFWDELKEAEQTTLASETYSLLIARKQFGLSAIAMGQHLAFIQNMLAHRKGAFGKYLKMFHFNGRTGYRYIEDYERLIGLVKEPVLKVMLQTGFKLSKATRRRPLGDFTEAYTALKSGMETPPTGMNMEAAIRYVKKLQHQKEELDRDPTTLAKIRVKVEESTKLSIEEKRDSPDFLLKQCFHLVKSALRRVEQKDEFLYDLVSYLLAERNITSKTFRAQPVPGTLQRGPGRPAKDDEDDRPIPIVAQQAAF